MAPEPLRESPPPHVRFQAYHEYGQTIDCGVNMSAAGGEASVASWLNRCAIAGVTDVVMIGYDIDSSRKVREYSESEKLQRAGVGLWFTAGVHPLRADSWDSSTEAALRELASHPNCVAIGEAGIDQSPTSMHPANPTPHVDVQRWVLQRHIGLAAQLKKPLYLHERDAVDTFLSEMQACHRPEACLVHCFNSSARALKIYLAKGFKIGIASLAACDGKGEDLRAVLRSVLPPLDSLLLETDAPYFRPDNMPDVSEQDRLQFSRDFLKTNEPSLLPLVALEVADCLDTHPRVVAQATRAATQRFFTLAGRRQHQAAAASPKTTSAPAGDNEDDDEEEDEEDGDDGTAGQPPSQHDDSDNNSARYITSLHMRRVAYSLRGVGVDTVLIRHNDVPAIAREAVASGRTLIVRHDKSGVLSREPGLKLLKVSTDNAAMQLREVLAHCSVRPTLEDLNEKRRCVSCNSCNWTEGAFEARQVRDGQPAGCLFQCLFCKKSSWHSDDLHKPHERLLQLLDGAFDHDLVTADSVAKAARGQRRSRCAFWTGLPGSCRNGNSCSFIHSYKGLRQVGADGSKLPDEVHVVVLHKTHGLLLIRPRFPGGPQWEIPTKRFTPSLQTRQAGEAAALELIDDSIGLRAERSDALTRLHRAVDVCTEEPLDNGRRLYYVLHIDDTDGWVQGTPGARPPLSGEDLWLTTIRQYTFMTDFSAAARFVKQSGAGSSGRGGDVVGALVLKRLSYEKASTRVRYTPQHTPAAAAVVRYMQHSGAAAALVARASLMQDSVDTKVSSLQRQLRTNHGVTHPSFSRLLWECPKSAGLKQISSQALEDVDAELQLMRKDGRLRETLQRQGTEFMRMASSGVARESGVLHTAAYVRDTLQELLPAACGSKLRLVAFGSSINGSADASKFDVDMCVVMCDPDTGETLGPFDRAEESTHLKQLHTGLLRLSVQEGQDGFEEDSFVSQSPKLVLAARVPVIGAVVRARGASIPIDLTLRPLGVINTLLLRRCFATYPHLRATVHALKRWNLWAGLRQVVSLPDGVVETKGPSPSIGSYAWVLLLLHALVHAGRVKPLDLDEFVLTLRSESPALQACPEGEFLDDFHRSYSSEGACAGFWHKVFCNLPHDAVDVTDYPHEALLSSTSVSGSTVAEYLEVFFRYYGWVFPYRTHVASASESCLTKDDANKQHGTEWASTPMCLQDPFEPALNLTRNLRDSYAKDLQCRARLSHSLLRQGRLASDIARAFS